MGAGTSESPYVEVGSKTGDGRWGHADLAGGTFEWIRNRYLIDWYTTTQHGCSNCANLVERFTHVVRGGSRNGSASTLRAAGRAIYSRAGRNDNLGWRCATDP
ncbi:MAG: SUMF1/EgtB/PvdO family nonheme iron enzyme [Polyangiaceae bacterium]|nr:SUMF1/EgtB/PvdO family nonheme iron enzyme [Polyangiaceae bacterium]